jgi:uncharacterized membrane protein (DUF2068 family)
VPKQHHTGVMLIAGFKVLKGVLFLTVGLKLLRLLHAEIATRFSQLLEALNLDAHSRALHALVLKVDALEPHHVLTISILSIAYAAVLLTEGLGLWFERRWAAYLTVIATSLFIPFELYEVIKRITAVRIVILLLNLIIVLYLIRQLKRHTLSPISHSLLVPSSMGWAYLSFS